MTDRLTERAMWDSSGMERIPFDGRAGSIRSRSRPTRFTASNHGPTCRPSNPEVGCECGEDERQELDAEARSLGFRSYDALMEAMGPERMAALERTHNPTICPNPERCPSCSQRTPAGELVRGQTVLLHGGVRGVVLSVTPYEVTDTFVPSSRWVTIHYRWVIATDGEAMTGRWSVPASQCLRVIG